MAEGLAFDDLNKKAMLKGIGFSKLIPVSNINQQTKPYQTFGINLTEHWGIGDPSAPSQMKQPNQLRAFPSGYLNGPRDQGATTGKASNDMRLRKINRGIDNNQGRGDDTITGLFARRITRGSATGGLKGVKSPSAPVGTADQIPPATSGVLGPGPVT
jgi:hypothetical protein